MFPLIGPNALLFAVRKKCIPQQEAIEFLNYSGVLPIEVDPTPDLARAANILSLAQKHRLTAYDATYLELAIRRKLPLATLDADLKIAARAESLVLL
ncbi:MAG: type II toxin-antitoxin system VapC family toxin [Candidatus Acidiferrales bacterium]